METEKRLIDVDELLHDTVWLCGGFVGDPYSDGYMDALDKVETVIRDSPTVDAVEVVHGRWERRIVDNECPWYVVHDCSVCGCSGESWHNYYPNCGAKMDGDGNG